MKKMLCMGIILFSAQVSLFAGSLDYLTNQSAKICMTFHRAASTDASADIVNYNPAGTAFLEKGLYLDLSSQTLIKMYSENGSDAGGQPGGFEQDTPTPVLPNFYAVYSFGNIGPIKFGNIGSVRQAVYFQAGIVAGGGTLEWKDGTIGTYIKYTDAFDDHGGISNHAFSVSSVYYGIGAGVACSFFKDLVSVSAGLRLVMPDRWVELSAQSVNIQGAHILGDYITFKGKYSYNAIGYTPIIGVDVKPLKGLAIGMRCEFETDLAFEYKKESLSVDPESVMLGLISVRDTVEEGLAGSGLYDGNKFNMNLPAIISTGAEYDMSAYLKGLTVMGSATFYLMPTADLGPYYNEGARIGNVNDFYSLGWEAGLGASYQMFANLKVGAGFMYTESGAKKGYFQSQYTIINCSANPPLDAVTMGCGGTYYFPGLGLDLTMGLAWAHYIPVKTSLTYIGENVTSTYNVKYDKDVYMLGFGIGYKL